MAIYDAAVTLDEDTIGKFELGQFVMRRQFGKETYNESNRDVDTLE